jgi:hypothetical protein
LPKGLIYLTIAIELHIWLKAKTTRITFSLPSHGNKHENKGSEG